MRIAAYVLWLGLLPSAALAGDPPSAKTPPKGNEATPLPEKLPAKPKVDLKALESALRKSGFKAPQGVKKTPEEQAREERDARLNRIRAQRKAAEKVARDVLKGEPVTRVYYRNAELHARRMADIDRVREVAADARDPMTRVRADQLRVTEEARYQEWLKAYARHLAAEAAKKK